MNPVLNPLSGVVSAAQRALGGAANAAKNSGGLISPLFGGKIKPTPLVTSPSLASTIGNGISSLVSGAGRFINNLTQPTQAQTPPQQPVQLPAVPKPRPLPALPPDTTLNIPGNTAPNLPSYSAPNYAQAITPYQTAISNYLSGRKSYSDVYNAGLESTGANTLGKILSGLDTDIVTQQSNLENIPKEDLARRADTGMLSEAARRRVEEAQARPIREQLLKTLQAKTATESGYNRALQIAGQLAQGYEGDTAAGLAPLQSDLDFQKQRFLGAENQGYSLQQQQAQLAAKQQESSRAQALTYNVAKDVSEGQTLNQVMGKYIAQGVDPDTILSLYNTYSPHGEANETPDFLASKYGVGYDRFGGNAQDILSQAILSGRL